MPRVIKNVTKLPESSPIDENRVKTTPILKESGEPTIPLKNPSLDKDIEESPREGGAGETVGVPAEKKVRQHLSLPAKYSKFIEFGYYLLNKISFDFIQDSNNEAVVFNEVEMLNKLNLLDPIDVQQQLVQEYFDTSKQIHKDLRDIVRKQQREAKKLAAASEKKTRKPRAKKTVDEDPSNEEEKPVKEKKTRAKKQKKESTEDALVQELVQLASGEPTVPPETPSLDKKQAAMDAVKDLLVNTEKVVVQEKPVKEKKEKPVKEKKEKPVKEPKQKKTKKEAVGTEISLAVPPQQSEEDDDELQVSVFELNGTQYLIDDDNTVYDFNTHLKIGTLINNNISVE